MIIILNSDHFNISYAWQLQNNFKSIRDRFKARLEAVLKGFLDSHRQDAMTVKAQKWCVASNIVALQKKGADTPSYGNYDDEAVDEASQDAIIAGQQDKSKFLTWIRTIFEGAVAAERLTEWDTEWLD